MLFAHGYVCYAQESKSQVAAAAEFPTFPIRVNGLLHAARAIPISTAAFDLSSSGGGKGFQIEMLVDASGVSSKDKLEIVLGSRVAPLILGAIHPDTRVALVRLVDPEWFPNRVLALADATEGERLFLPPQSGQRTGHRISNLRGDSAGSYIETSPSIPANLPGLMPLSNENGIILALTRARSAKQPTVGKALGLGTIVTMTRLAHGVMATALAPAISPVMPANAKAALEDRESVTEWLVRGKPISGKDPLDFVLENYPEDIKNLDIDDLLGNRIPKIADAYLEASNIAWRFKPTPLVLLCNLSTADNSYRRDDNLEVDLQNKTVNRWPATISDGEITFEAKLANNAVYTHKLNRYSGTISISTPQFPNLLRGTCQPVGKRQF